MRFSKSNSSRLFGLFIAMIPLGVNADTGQITGQIACPTLLTEPECHDYQTALRQAKSEAERGVLEDKYAALLKERFLMCPSPIRPNEVEAGLHIKRPRLFVGRKINM